MSIRFEPRCELHRKGDMRHIGPASHCVVCGRLCITARMIMDEDEDEIKGGTGMIDREQIEKLLGRADSIRGSGDSEAAWKYYIEMMKALTEILESWDPDKTGEGEMNKSKMPTFLMCNVCEDIFKVAHEENNMNGAKCPHCKAGTLEEIEIRKVKPWERS